MLFNAHPKVAAVQNNEGHLPLHYALHSNALPDMINMLLHAYPKAVEVRQSDGRLPLHYACMFEIHLCDNILEVLNLLILDYPEGIGTQEKYGKLLSDYLTPIPTA
jgi:ankyrin repeat protein